MEIKGLLYLLIVPIVTYSILGLNIETLFKKNKRLEIVLFFLILVISLSYLVVNFFFDFYLSNRIFY